MLGRDRGRADDHLGAVRLEHVALVLADLVGADEDALVALAPGRPSPARRRCCRRSARRSCRRAGARRRPRRPRSSGSAMRSFTEPPGLRYSTLASTSGPPLAVRRGRGDRREPQQRGVADQVQEGVHVLHPANLEAGRSRPAPSHRLRSLWAWGKPARHASSPPPRRTAAAACPCSGAGLYGLLRAEAKLARKAIGEPRDEPPPDATGWYGRGRPGPGDQGRAARRLQRGRVRRRAGRGDARRPARQRRRRAGRPAGPPARVRRRRRRSPPTWPARSTGRCRPSRDVAVILIGANDVTHAVLPGESVRHLVRGGTPAARRRRRGRGRHLPRPRHHQADRRRRSSRSARAWSRRLAAAQTIAVRRGGRPHRLARLDPRARSSRPPRRCCSGPTSSTRRPPATARWSTCCCPRPWPRSAWPRGRGRARGRAAARACCRSPTAAVQAVKTPGTELDGTEVARLAAAASAASGSSCGTAAASPHRGRGARRRPRPVETASCRPD